MISNRVFRTSLLWGGVLTVVLAAGGAIVGGIVDDSRGAVSALLGALVAAFFFSFTAISILVANRQSKSELFVPLFFGIVMGGWIVKFVVFLVLAWVLRQQPWINEKVFFLTMIVGVLCSLVIDVVVAMRTRIPHTGDVALPGEEESGN